MSVARETQRAAAKRGPATAVAVDLDPLEVRVAVRAARDDETGRRVVALRPIAKSPLPPAAIVPRFAGEPIEVDLEQPPHPYGSGDVWPPEARVRAGRAPWRLPAGLAWALLEREATWKCADDEAQATLDPADALAAIYDVAARRATAGGKAPPAHALLVPSYLSAAQRQVLTAALRRRGRRVALIDRCFCAARLWLDHVGVDLDSAAPATGSPVIGRILTIDLGLVRWETHVVELVAADDGRPQMQVSADTAELAPLPSYGLDLLQRLAARTAEMSQRQASPGRVWELLWCTAWVQYLLALLRSEEVEAPPPVDLLAPHVRTVEFVRQQCRRASQHILGAATEVPALLANFIAPSPQLADLNQWLNTARRAAAKQRFLGVVVSGAMAVMPHDQALTLAAHCARQIAPQAGEPLVEGADWAPGGLARGALLPSPAIDA